MDKQFESSAMAFDVTDAEKMLMETGIEDIGKAGHYFKKALGSVTRGQFSTDRDAVIGLGNRASERIYNKGPYKADEVFTLNGETAYALKSRLGQEKLGLLMSRFTTAMDLALKLEDNNNPVVKEGLIKAGNEASVELFGPKTRKIVFE